MQLAIVFGTKLIEWSGQLYVGLSIINKSVFNNLLNVIYFFYVPILPCENIYRFNFFYVFHVTCLCPTVH